MDLRQLLFRHHRYPHVRYANDFHPTDFVPPPYTHRLPPPPPLPQPHPPDILLPPPPPPPRVRRHHMAHPPLPPRFTLSPPHDSIVDRSHLYEFDSPRKPYFHHELVPPPPPPPPPPLPPPIENIPLGVIHDYPQQNHSIVDRSHLYEFDSPEKPYFHNNLVPPPPPPPPPPLPSPIENIPLGGIHDYPDPIFRDEIFRQSFSDKYVRELPENRDRNLRSREVHTRFPIIRDHERYVDIFHQSRDLYNKWDDAERWDDGPNNWGCNLYNERDYGERIWDGGIHEHGRELYNERDYNERRWNSVSDEQGHELYNGRRNYEERNWDDGINDLGRELYGERDCNKRRWNGVFIEQGQKSYNSRRNYEERNWNVGINDLGCELYREDDRIERRLDYGSNDGVLLQLENRQREFVGDDLPLGRFNGRLERVVAEEEYIRSKKKRRLEKDALHRIQFGKDCSRQSGDYRCQPSLKEFRRSSVRGQEKDRFDCLPTRLEDMGEGEQSPLELAISFKSNSLIAKAILTPAPPDLKLDVNSTDVNNRIPNSPRGSSSSKSSKDLVKTNASKSGLDLPSDSHGTSKGLLDKVVVSGSGSLTANDTSDLGLKNEPPKEMNLRGTTDGRTHTKRLRKRRRTRKQLLHDANLQMKNEGGDTSNASDFSNIPSAAPQLNSDTALLKGNFSSAIIVGVPDTGLVPSPGGIVSDKGDSSGDSFKTLLPTLKRKRSLTTLSAFSDVADKVFSECSSDADKCTYDNTDTACQLTINEGAHRANETFLANAGQGDSLGINQHANNVDSYVHNRDSVLDAENRTIESRPPETSMSDVQEDEYFSEIHQSNSSSESDGALLQKPKNVIISDMGLADANLKEDFLNLVSIPQVVVTAEEFRSLEVPAVADCSNISLRNSTSSNFLSAGHKGIVAQFGISFHDAVGKKSLTDGANLTHNINSVEGSPEAISHLNPCLSIDYSPKIIRKRKARGAQTGLSGSSANMVIGTVRSTNGEVSKLFAKDLVPDVEVAFLDGKDSYGKDDSLIEGTHGVQDSTMDVNCGANGSFTSYKKKRKVVSPRSNLLSILEDDTAQDRLASYCTKHDQGCTRLAECGAEQREDAASPSPSATAAINKCSSTDVEDKIRSENLFFAELDRNLADGGKLHVNDDLPSIAHHLLPCADRSGICASNSGNELLASGFGMRSCMSSPEVLLLFSDLSFSRNTEAPAFQSENETISGGDSMSDGILVSGDLSTSSLGKSLEKTASDNSQTNAEIPPTSPEDTNKVVKKLNLVHGKPSLNKHQLTSAGPKVFSGYHPRNSSFSRKFHSTHITKSRTWHRTGSGSVAVTEPKLQPSPLPQSHVTKTAGTTQSSYIRKGNSLVRKPSPAAVSIPGVRGSSSSVFRLNACIDNLKGNQASDNKTCHAVGPTVPRVKRVNTSETPEAQPLNHGRKSLSCAPCNMGESVPLGNLPSSGSRCKASDALEESMKSSVVPESRTDAVMNSDYQMTPEEGNVGKKIMYVKRRSNQLVAASSSDDRSMLGVDKTQASVSDGYYKSKKNQILRASSESHVKKEDANVNSCWLVSRTSIPKTSIRRQSFAKSYRHLKFSSVWKLHDIQSLEKRKNSVGPQKVLPHLFPKKATYWRSFMHALGTKPNNSPFSSTSQKLLLSRKRGAIYTRSTHGYSLRMSKILSVGGTSLKWSKSIERNSRKANEEATQAVAAAEKRKKEEKGAVSTASKSRNHVSRKLVLSVKLRPGERIFRVGSERYKMDSTRRTLQRITAEKEPSCSGSLQSGKNVKRSYVPRRLLIGNEEYVRIGNGNQLVRDPKKRTRILASEKVRWSLRTARLRLARKRKYCQFFTRFGKCNKEDGKCPYIHDPSKIVVCTKFLNGSCSIPDCKLTHEVIPERMQDCSYFLRGSCSNENCPYRHVNVDPESTVCESFLRGYCADGNECRKKHTYVCPAFEATGNCPQAATCKLHHPKKKTEKKPSSEQKIVRGRYFDGGLIGDADCSMFMTEKVSSKGKDDMLCHKGKFPDYISLDVSDDEEMDHTPVLEQVPDDILPDARIEPVDELDIVL